MGLFSFLRRLLGRRDDVVDERRDRQPEQRRRGEDRGLGAGERSGHGADRQGTGPRRMNRD